ncbi:MAG: hypothetical protein JSV65_00280 [Armatimonadota bacterium]|nr:MAG: hypothetical protein JSV65_00280 [Armatimonadota bacterium]
MINLTYSRTPRSAGRPAARWYRLLFAALPVLLAAHIGLAQTRAEQAEPAQAPPASPNTSQEATAPAPFRAVALVDSDGGMEAVSMLFPWAQDHQEVTSIVEHMSQLGGWDVVDLKIEDDRFVSAWDLAMEKDPQGELQTYVEFSAAGVVNHEERWIPLDPFIVALKDYSPMRLALAVGEQVVVEGPGDFEDNTVRIECNRQLGSILYDITVKDPDLTSTGVPAHPAAPVVPAPQVVPQRRAPLLAGLLVGLALAVATGVALTLRRKGLWPWAANKGGDKPCTSDPAPNAQSD